VTEAPPTHGQRVLAWLAPTALGATTGALAGGLTDAAGLAAPAAIAVATGFAALGLLPALLVLGALGRGLLAAWRPHRLAGSLVGAGGGAPRLLAWLLFLGLAAFVLSWATFNGVRILAITTSFKPVAVSLAMPVITIATTLILLALSRPLVDLFAAIITRLDRRAAARGRSRVTPRWIAGYAAVVIGGLLAVAWFVTLQPRVGDVQLGIGIPVVVAIATAAVAHAVWRRLGRTPRRAALLVATAVTAAAIAGAIASRGADPGRVLAVWGDTAIAGAMVDRLYDLDRVHADLPLAALRPAVRPGAPHRDIVLVTIDTVRADRTPLGGGPASMPTLAGLGNRGAVFEWAFAPGNVTRRSLPTIALGLSPTRVRGRVAGWALRLDPRHVLLAERLRAGGYDTAGFFCCGSFWGAEHRLGFDRGIDHVVLDQRGGPLARAARTWIEERDRRPDRKPLFLWMHFIEPHNWTGGGDGPRGADARRKLYDDSLTRVDGFLADVVAAFGSRPPGQEPLIVVTADHGEGLGDHGAEYHSAGLHNAQLRVPLVVAGPGVRAQRIGEPVGLADLAPTLLDLAGFVPPAMPVMDGRSLADLVTGARKPDPEAGYAYSAQVRDRSVATPMRMIVQGRWKLIESPSGLELFDIRADPGELRNLARSRPAELTRMKALLLARSAIEAVTPFR
jgi:arylsulfatase A-like enzyme